MYPFSYYSCMFDNIFEMINIKNLMISMERGSWEVHAIHLALDTGLEYIWKSCKSIYEKKEERPSKFLLVGFWIWKIK